MEEGKICNFNIKDKNNFSFTKYIKKDNKIKIIKYEQEDGEIKLNQYDDESNQLKTYKESKGKKFYDQYDLNDKIQVIKYQQNENGNNDQKYLKYNEN